MLTLRGLVLASVFLFYSMMVVRCNRANWTLELLQPCGGWEPATKRFVSLCEG
jgi:hypothetical protein